MKKITCVLAVLVLTTSSVVGQTARSSEIVPDNNLVAEGVPPIPSLLARTVSRYRGCYGYPVWEWDMVKRAIWLKILSAAGTWLSQIDRPGAYARPLIEIPMGPVYDVYRQPRGEYVLFNKDNAGDELFQFYLYDLASRETKLLTDGKSRNTEPVWSNRGDRIVYCSSTASTDGVDLSLMNPFEPGKSRLLARGQGHYLKAYDWSPDDRQVVVCDYASNTASSLWILDVSTGQKRLLSREKQRQVDYYDTPAFSKDGKGVYVLTDRDSEFRRLAYVDLATLKYKYLTDQYKWDVEEFALSPDGKTIAFITNEDGISRLHWLNTKTGDEKSAASLPIGIISDLKWRNDSVDLAFNLKSPQTPNDVYSVNTSTCRVEHWYKGYLGQLAAEKLPKPELIHWKSFDGKSISGLLYRPPASFTGKRPVIIEAHGGPTEQYRPGFGYDDNYFIDELGVVMIYPNIRGSTGYGKTFADLDNGMLRQDSIKDIGALFDWIRDQPELDSNRVMVEGTSHGGYVALSVAVAYNDRIRGTISDSGASNLVEFIEKTAGWRRDIQREEYGDERDPKVRQYLERIAPINNVDKIKKPLLVIQGQNDPRVPVAGSQEMVAALKKRGVPVWYLLAKDEGHGWTKQSNWDFRLYVEALFVQDYLLK